MRHWALTLLNQVNARRAAKLHDTLPPRILLKAALAPLQSSAVRAVFGALGVTPLTRATWLHMPGTGASRFACGADEAALGQPWEVRMHQRQGLALYATPGRRRPGVFTGVDVVTKQPGASTAFWNALKWVVLPAPSAAQLNPTRQLDPLKLLDRGFFFPDKRAVAFPRPYATPAHTAPLAPSHRAGGGRTMGGALISALKRQALGRPWLPQGRAATLYGVRLLGGSTQRTSNIARRARFSPLSTIARYVTRLTTTPTSAARRRYRPFRALKQPQALVGRRWLFARKRWLRRIRPSRGARGRLLTPTGLGLGHNWRHPLNQLPLPTPPLRLHTPHRREAAASLGTIYDVAVPQIEAQILAAQKARLDFDFRSLMGQFKQPQVRYRPGMATYWRHYRRTFSLLYCAPWNRQQKRLTRYVARIRRVACFSYFKLLLLSIGALAYFSHLAPLATFQHAFEVVRCGWVRLNGRPCLNPFAQVYGGDVLSWRRGGDPIGYRPSHEPRQYRHVWRATQIWENPQGWRGDTPAHLEVDELTASVGLLFEPREWGFLLEQPYPTLPFLTLKCYNWKYIT